MQTYVSDHGKSQILKLKKAKRKAKRKIMKMTMKRKKAEDELLSLKDRFGTEKKLNDDQCVGNSCYMFTKIATPTMKSASAKQPADYKDMSWSCRRHSATAGHTRSVMLKLVNLNAILTSCFGGAETCSHVTQKPQNPR